MHVSVNDQMPIFAYNRLVKVFGDVSDKKVTFLGVSYRGDVGDTRYTPVAPLVEMVRETGAEIILHDPFVSFWEEQQCFVESDLNSVLDSTTDLIVLSAGHSQYKLKSTIDKLMALKSTLISWLTESLQSSFKPEKVFLKLPEIFFQSGISHDQ